MSIIPNPVLDPRNEEQLAQSAIQRTYHASGEAINQRNDHGVTAALQQGFAYSGAELLWYINKLPRALAVQFLQLTGVVQSQGTVARTTLRFTLSQPYSTPIVIPAGFEVKTQRTFTTRNEQTLVFHTESNLTIAAGLLSGEIDAVCSTLGAAGNVAAGTLTRVTTPYSYLNSVTNPSAAFGGSDPEGIDDVERRILTDIRRREIIVSEEDYIQESQNIMGLGSRAVVVPLLAADRVSRQLGTVHVFGVFPDGTVPNESQALDIQEELQTKVPLGTTVYFSPVDLDPINLKIVAQLDDDNGNVNTTSQSLFTVLQSYISPIAFPKGESHLVTNDVEFVSRIPGIKRISAILINGEERSRLMRNRWTLPTLRGVYLELLDSVGNVYPFAYGEGDPD